MDEIISQIETVVRQIIRTYSEIVNLKPQRNSFANSDLFQDASLFNGEIILRELDGFRNSVEDKRKLNKRIFESNFKKDEILLELIIIEHQSLFVTLLERFNFSRKEFDGIDSDSYTFKSVSFSCHLLNLLINNLVAIQQILYQGLNHQVNLILRNYIELAELSVAVIADEIFFNHYLSTPTERKDVIIKRQKIKPSAIHKLVGMEYSKIDGFSGWWMLMDQARNSLYAKTSGSVHGDYNSVINESYSNELNVDNVTFTSLGLISENVQTTLKEVIVYSKVYINSLIIFLVSNHGLHFNRFGQVGKNHVYLNSVNSYMLEYYLSD